MDFRQQLKHTTPTFRVYTYHLKRKSVFIANKDAAFFPSDYFTVLAKLPVTISNGDTWFS